MDHCSSKRGAMAQDGGLIGGTFVSWRNEPLQREYGLGYACSSMPERAGRNKERIARSKRVRASSLVIVD